MNETFNDKESSMELKMHELLLAYARRWKLILLCTILAGAIMLGYTMIGVTPMYRTGATIYVNNARSVDDKEYMTGADWTAATYLVKGYMVLAESDTVLERVAERLDEKYSTSQLRGMITVSQVEKTVIFAVYVTHSNPKEAAHIANVVAEVIPLAGPEVIVGSSARVIDTAKVPVGRYSPSYTRNALIGAVAGLLLAVVYVTIMCLRDTHIKDENDLTDMFELPILGIIPDMDEVAANSSSSESSKKE